MLSINDIVTDTLHWHTQKLLSRALTCHTLCSFLVSLCPVQHTNQVSAASYYLPAQSILNTLVSPLAFFVRCCGSLCLWQEQKGKSDHPLYRQYLCYTPACANVVFGDFHLNIVIILLYSDWVLSCIFFYKHTLLHLVNSVL